MSSVETLWQFLQNGDLLGFLQAIYIMAFQSVDVFYGIVTMIITGAIYIRVHSLPFLCIMWILIGSFFMTVLPLVAGLGVLLIILGLGGIAYQLYMVRGA